MILDFKEMITCVCMSLDRCVNRMALRTTFTLRVGHLALGCRFHVDIFNFFCAILLVLRCGIGSEMSTPNFKSTLNIWKLRSQQMGSLTCSRTLFSLLDPLLSLQGM